MNDMDDGTVVTQIMEVYTPMEPEESDVDCPECGGKAEVNRHIVVGKFDAKPGHERRCKVCGYVWFE